MRSARALDSWRGGGHSLALMRSRAAKSRLAPAPRKRGRVPADERRRQLVGEAGRLLTQHGCEHLQITELAVRAHVSRPLVYRLFPTRQALVRAVLDDFAAFVSERFQRAVQSAPRDQAESIARAFVEACCDAIEQKGAGAWRLLDARGADPELARLGRTIFVGMLDPWHRQLATFLAIPSRRATSVLWVIVAAGRAALDGWIEGAITRAHAVDDATRAVTSLLRAFASATATHPS